MTSFDRLEWSYLTFTLSDTGQATIFRNGVQLVSASRQLWDTGDTSMYFMGEESTVLGIESYAWKMDEFRAYTRVLSLEEIVNAYQGLGWSSVELQIFYTFSEAASNVITDQSS